MDNKRYGRRDFLGDAVRAGAAGILSKPFIENFPAAESITVNQVIERILSEVPGGRLADTVDTLKSGSGDMAVTGIVTTMFATVPVIRSAAKMKSNFIIAHEPTFYNHQDDANWVENNMVVKEKKDFLEKTGIAVWRFHDNWHRMKPDGILHGFLQKTGWLSYNNLEENIFQMPAQPLIDVVRHLKDSLHIPHLRYIGDPSSTCSIVALIPGAAGGQRQVRTSIAGSADLIIVGESPEWETAEYVRDARALGKQMSMIVLGHGFSEEAGMEYLAQWLQPKIPGIKINFISSGEAYSWY